MHRVSNIMVRPCVIKGCESNHRKYGNNSKYAIPKRRCVFQFPTKKPELYNQWLTFLNSNVDGFIEPQQSDGVCILHFEKKFLNFGKRTTLKWDLNPVPTMSTPVEDHDKIEFEDLNSSMSPKGFEFKLEDDSVIYYRIGKNLNFNIPEIIETIKIDKSLHTRLFLKS